MQETFKARYIDPMIDWSFKRLFGSEVNKDILIEFLKVIFPEFDIEDITYLPSEQLGIMEKDRRARRPWRKRRAIRRNHGTSGSTAYSSWEC